MISGGRITGVEAKRLKEGLSEGLSVNINIDSVKRDGGKIVVSYSYTIDYSPEIAKMTVSGEIFLQEDEAEAKKIEKEWQDKKIIGPALAEELLTAITYSSSTVGTLAAFAIGVNAPINVPRARIVPKEEGGAKPKTAA